MPIYFSSYHIGRIALELIGVPCPHLSVGEFKVLFSNIVSLNISHSFSFLARVFGVTSIGGWMMGLLLATASSALYRMSAYEITKTYTRLQELQRKRLEAIERGESVSRKTPIPFPRQKRRHPSD